MHIDDTPTMISLFDGDECVVSDSKLCAQVHVNADKFAINSKFACKVVVSKPYTRSILKAPRRRPIAAPVAFMF